MDEACCETGKSKMLDVALRPRFSGVQGLEDRAPTASAVFYSNPRHSRRAIYGSSRAKIKYAQPSLHLPQNVRDFFHAADSMRLLFLRSSSKMVRAWFASSGSFKFSTNS